MRVYIERVNADSRTLTAVLEPEASERTLVVLGIEKISKMNPGTDAPGKGETNNR
jgi:hypothetical protein